ncbi:olfactory receptor 1500-like [Erpetoichthys calabaricus]|uniref:olfactory receptor 1500-like n=1 Tax=Erpetoichthys calabaricus TaxID=27687 RepID=UPI00109EE486|nr:olfactory receptor 1500-like [Erpetoichthys calabaricus]
MAIANATSATTLIFTAYVNLSNFRHFCFIIAFLMYLITVFFSVSLMLLVYLENSLHKPMYIFLFNLILNGLLGCNSFYPKFLSSLFSDIPETTHITCLMQAFCIGVYGGCTYATLSLMAYDRYISICNPLRYHDIITPLKIKLLLIFGNLFPILCMLIHILLTARLPICGNTIHKIFCDNWAIVKLSCVETGVNNVFGLFLTTILVVFPFVLVIYSYMKILLISLKASKEAQYKALSTCAPHLITFINFSIASIFSIIYNRFEMKLEFSTHILMSMQFIIIPPLLHPIIYGIRTKEIRKCIIKAISRRKVTSRRLLFSISKHFPTD